MTCGAHKLYDHEHHHFGIVKLSLVPEHGVVDVVEINITVLPRLDENVLEHPPAEILGYKSQQRPVLHELADDIVDQKDHPVLDLCDACRFKSEVRSLEDLARLVRYQFVPDIIFVLKIQIEGSFCHACSLHDIRYGCLVDPLAGEKPVCRLQQGLPLDLLVLIYFAHFISSYPI